MDDRGAWPTTEAELVALQRRLASDAAALLASDPWEPGDEPVVAGCFATFERGESVPGRAGDRAWAAAVSWRARGGPPSSARHPDHHLSGPAVGGEPRRADDALDQAVVVGPAPAPYVPGLLAMREGALLAAASGALDLSAVDVLLVDATGLDHPRRAGLAVHLGAVLGIPTVGVTRRPLVASGEPPGRRRGDSTALVLDGEVVGRLVCTRSGSGPLAAHAAWRTSADVAAQVVLASSTPAARTPVPLQEARRVAREARSLSHGA